MGLFDRLFGLRDRPQYAPASYRRPQRPDRTAPTSDEQAIAR